MTGTHIIIMSGAALLTGAAAEKWAAPRLQGRFIQSGHPTDEVDDRALAWLVAGGGGLIVGAFLAWLLFLLV